MVLCLFGCAFYYLWRRQSSESSSEWSARLEEQLEELKAFKRTVMNDLESQFDRIRSVAGRVDRAKRKETTSQEPQGEALTDPLDLNDQGNLNRLMAKRLYGGG